MRPVPPSATDFPLELDPGVRRLDGGRWLMGGDPGRMLRLSQDGIDALGVLGRDGPRTPAERALARKLVDGGLAHPVPRPVSPSEVAADVTVVVPVRDRAAELDRCLTALGRSAPVLVVDDCSDRPDAVARVCASHDAGLLRLTVHSGPGAARNAGLAMTSSPVVAFIDSDCLPPPHWLLRLLGHLADPAVAAVAPRVVASSSSRSVLARYAAARGPLDLAPRPAWVRPGTRVPYVPTAALVVRRSALPLDAAFEPTLRYGEDVDLVWRLHDAGWVVRYDPRTCVQHDEPDRWRTWLARRYRYGTSAAPLAQRHGGRLCPIILPPWSTATWLLLLTGHPGQGIAIAALLTLRLHRRLRKTGLGRVVCAREAVLATGRGISEVAGGFGGAGTVTTAPVLLALLLCRRTRHAAAAALLVPPLREWCTRRSALDPLRWSAVRLVDDLAYAAGVWRGCVAGRTLAPLRPRMNRPT